MTTLSAYATPPAAMLAVGGRWALGFVTYDAYGCQSGAVTPTITVTKPDTSTVAVIPVYLGSGLWEAVYTVAAAGRHLAAVATPEDRLDLAAYVDVVTTAAGMPTAADVSVYLGANAGTWSMAEITDALGAERAAQRNRCGERALYPDDLRQALLRRVQRNLAMRRFPLGMTTGDADSGPAMVPGRDPEVRRLEAPYRRLVIG